MTPEDRRKPRDPAQTPDHVEVPAQEVVDRRVGIDRRDLSTDPTNLERRRGPGRRLTDFVKTAEEGEMNREQYLFLLAIDAFKRVNHKTFPSWTDVLEIIRKLDTERPCPVNSTWAAAPPTDREGERSKWCEQAS